jgi:outer membrane protein TolC
MLKSKNKFVLIVCLVVFLQVDGQEMSLQKILETIHTNNPLLKMQDEKIASMDTLAFGARSWMNPQVNTGLFMTPYNPKMWSANGGQSGMGNYMVGVTQMIPNSKKQDAYYTYLKEVSMVEQNQKEFNINKLNSLAKSNFYQWLILEKKKSILKENQELLSYLMKSIEIRYEFNNVKLPNYYKASAQYERLGIQIIQFENDIEKKRIALNTLMFNDQSTVFTIDTTYELKSFDGLLNDTSLLVQNRSDLKAIESQIKLNDLKINLEKAKMLPEFGVQYNQMFAFGSNPQMFSLMAMASIPMPWSTKMNQAQIVSTKYKNEALKWEKTTIVNSTQGRLNGLNEDLKSKQEQLAVLENKLLPALKKNYDLNLLAWQNNTGNLYEVLDAWEMYNMTQIERLDKLEKIILLQVEIEQELELK